LCIKTGSKVFPGVKIPFNWLYGAQPTCCALLFIVLKKHTYEILLKMCGKGVKE
jgi:TRAP-type C4-dicarboxylate transport system permease small subunit